MATPRADHLRDAFLGLSMERYDHEVTLTGGNSGRVEEVYIFSNYASIPLQFLPLAKRRETLQLNMRAVDEAGTNLVLVARSELEAIYAELFADAIPYLRSRKQLPPRLRKLVRANNWAEQLFHGTWIEDAREEEGFVDELSEYFLRRFQKFSTPPTPPEAATLVFADYIVGKLLGRYRPVVQLREPVDPVNPASGGVAQKRLVKYVVDDRTVFEEAKFRGAVLGYSVAEIDFPVEISTSTHIRFRPPAGTVLGRPLELPARTSDRSIERHQVQFYLRRPHVLDFSQPPPTEVSFAARITQTASIRFITAALYFALALLPALLVEVVLFSQRPDGYGLSNFVQEFHWSGVYPTLQLVKLDQVTQSFQIGVPLAVGLFAASWDRPHVRSFVVTQLMIAVGLTLLWVLTPAIPLMGATAVVAGFILTVFNVYEGGKAMCDLPD